MGKVIEFQRPQEGYRLVLAFDSDDPEFTRGVEVGRMYEALRPHTAATVDFQVHGSNRVMVERIAQATGYAVEILDEIYDESRTCSWINVRFLWRAL